MQRYEQELNAVDAALTPILQQGNPNSASLTTLKVETFPIISEAALFNQTGPLSKLTSKPVPTLEEIAEKEPAFEQTQKTQLE